MSGDVLTRPRALVVVESMFGNTAAVAAALAQGLAEEMDVEVVPAASAAPLEEEVDLVVVGAPTHAFSLSRPITRADAARQGAAPERARIGMREWLESAYHAGLSDLHVAVFDTRITKVRRLPAAAGPKAARLAKHRHFEPIGKPVAFLVEDMKGPLLDGELERAETWGRMLSAGIHTTVA